MEQLGHKDHLGASRDEVSEDDGRATGGVQVLSAPAPARVASEVRASTARASRRHGACNGRNDAPRPTRSRSQRLQRATPCHHQQRDGCVRGTKSPDSAFLATREGHSARRGARTPPRDHQEHPPLPTACSAPTLSTPHSHGAAPPYPLTREPRISRARDVGARVRVRRTMSVACHLRPRDTPPRGRACNVAGTTRNIRGEGAPVRPPKLGG